MVVAPALVDLGVLLALGVLIGLSYAYRYSLGAVILATAALLGAVRLPGVLGGGRLLGFAADALLKVDHSIRHALGRGINDMQAAWNEAVSWTAYSVHWLGKEIASLAHDTAQAVEGLHVTQVTNVYRKVNPGLAAKVGALAATVAALRHQLVREASRVAHVAQAKAVAVQHAISVPDVGALPRAVPRVGQLEREISEGLARLRDYAKRFGPATAVGTVAFVLGRLGMTWARCSKVNRVGRGVCGLNDSLLESLLADALLVVGAISVVEFAEELQALESATVSAMRGFVREL